MPSFLACSRTGTGDTNSARRESAGAESERRNLGDCVEEAQFSRSNSRVIVTLPSGKVFSQQAEPRAPWRRALLSRDHTPPHGG